MIILSPSKGQDFSPVDPLIPCTLPEFPEQTQVLINTLRQHDLQSLCTLMNISPNLAERTLEQIHAFSFPFSPKKTKPALLAFSGEVYRAINPNAYSLEDLLFAQGQVRILSGLYGCLRPLDLIQPYRLEMAAKLATATAKNLSAFWSGLITDNLNTCLEHEQDPLLINLASHEYARVIRKDRLKASWLDIEFKEEKDGKLRSIAVFAKRARGLMTGFILRNRIQQVADLQQFTGNGYAFQPHHSRAGSWVFTRPLT